MAIAKIFLNKVACRPKRLSFVVCLLITCCTGVVHSREVGHLSGCYDVRGGYFEVSRAIDFDDMIGRYEITLKKQDAQNGVETRHLLKLRGALKGTPHTPTETGLIINHVMSTNNRVGTLSSKDDVLTNTAITCVDSNGLPAGFSANVRYFFKGGTGVFSGIQPGSTVYWEGIFDGCTDPANPVADFEAISGELCFE